MGNRPDDGQLPLWIRTWAPEILSLTLSICLVATIVGILQAYDGKPQPDLGPTLTLNGLIQFIATIAQFTFSYPLARGLGQLKWLWFLPRKPHPLRDFEAYDDACRGSWGSLKLAFRLRGGSGIRDRLLTQVAALVLASAILNGPFTQQALVFDTSIESPSLNGTATLTRVSTMSRSVDGSVSIDDLGNIAMRSAIFHAAQATTDRFRPHIMPLAPNCTTARCEWEPYNTLGICGKLVNLTATNLTGTRYHREWTLATIEQYLNNTFIGMPEAQDPEIQATLTALLEPMRYVSIYSHLDPSVQLPEDLMKAASAELIVAYSDDGNIDMVTSARFSNIDKFKFLAMQFFYCTRTFQTRVIDGVPETKELGRAIQVVSSTVRTVNPAWNEDMRTPPEGLRFESPCPSIVKNQTLVLAPPPASGRDGETFTIDACTGLLASGELIGSSNGMGLYVDKAGYVANIGILSTPVGLALQGGLGSQPGPLDQATQWSNMELLVNNIADSLTNMLREAGPSFVGNEDGILEGIAYAQLPLIRVRWGWLVLAMVQVVLCAIILGIVIHITSKTDVEARKDSSIAALCALDSSVKEKLGPWMNMKGAKSGSALLKVRLEKTEEGYQLCLVDESKPP
ncbi:hypothetical protein QBC34DRAFT_493069 [Podospora aff. communis PSN243]|uniref:Uncharacterized protein n=1 Tax=Podospora aff. communis PSN243 TaxID=3040156 RepID=A0AAV9GVI8_9PEZI|nr:hypothetical protein QBC34DRAFT_493069 [Podospora aff. communis PSN243]